MSKQDEDTVTFAIHQPNYIPWLGYFYKMWRADIFVYLDTVQFPRGQSFANRNRIKTPNGVSYLTIPVSVPSGEEGKAAYTEVEFANEKWQRKHEKTLQRSYARADYYEEIAEIYSKTSESETDFVSLNIALIESFAEYLDITTTRVRLSELLTEYGQKTELIVDIARALDADVYLSGEGGGREYNDEAVLNSNDIQLKYTGFQHPEYAQLWGDFESHLSIIDLLFNHGKNSRNILLAGKDENT